MRKFEIRNLVCSLGDEKVQKQNNFDRGHSDSVLHYRQSKGGIFYINYLPYEIILWGSWNFKRQKMAILTSY